MPGFFSAFSYGVNRAAGADGWGRKTAAALVHPEFSERNAWRLFNAATHAFTGRVAENSGATSTLHRIIDGACEAILAGYAVQFVTAMTLVASLVKAHAERRLEERLTELSMSRMMPSGGSRSWTRSIQAPQRSARAFRSSSVASHSVSNRPIWLLDAASRSDDRPHDRIADHKIKKIDELLPWNWAASQADGTSTQIAA